MDADTLLLNSPDFIFKTLDDFDWVTYDFQHKDLSHVYDINSPQLGRLFSPEQLRRQVFCSGFYASHRGLLDPDKSQEVLNFLESGEAEVLYPMAPDQTLLNYWVMRAEVNSCNLALTLPGDQRTGNSVTSSHFEVRDGRVYDKGIPLTYLHYIGISSKVFHRLCQGENVDFPYRDIFLHYRYRHNPASRPPLAGRLIPYKPPTGWRRYLQPIAQLLPTGAQR